MGERWRHGVSGRLTRIGLCSTLAWCDSCRGGRCRSCRILRRLLLHLAARMAGTTRSVCTMVLDSAEAATTELACWLSCTVLSRSQTRRDKRRFDLQQCTAHKRTT
jgi:hypothetical protein